MTIASRLREYGSTPRILGVDLARGLAMLGMFGAHVGYTGDGNLLDPWGWLSIVHGRSAVLFALLAGVSIAILSGRSTPLDGVELLQARTRILARAVVIFAVGGILEALGTNVAVILPVYALLFVGSLPFLRWSSKRLFLLAGALALVSPVVAALYLGLGAIGVGGASAFLDLLITGPYPGIIWIVFVLVGLGVGRLDLASKAVAVRLVVAGVIVAVAGYGIGGAAELVTYGATDSSQPVAPSSSSAAAALPQNVDADDLDLAQSSCDVYDDGTAFCYPDDFYDQPQPEYAGSSTPLTYSVDLSSLVTIAPHSGSPFEVVGATGFALLVLGLSLLVARRLRWVLYPLIAVGAMALTAYSAHIVVLAVIGQSAYGRPDNWLYLAFVVGALVFCGLWTLLLGRGPLERGLSRVSRMAARLTPKLDPTPEPIEKV